MSKITNCLIIGSGPAGLTAGIYTARAGLNPIVISGSEIGGQLLKTNHINNFPGFIRGSGADLMDLMRQQYLETGSQFLQDEILSLDLSQRPFLYHLSSQPKIPYKANTVIIASGTKNKWLNVKNEDLFKGRGISLCATCDGFFYKNKIVAVIGGGNSALYEALYLANIAQKVYLITKNKSLSGEFSLKQQVLANPKIILFFETNVLEFMESQKLQAMKLQRKKESFILEIQGVFEAIGSQPNVAFLNNQLKLTKKGFIKTNKTTMQTSVSGVFACGDIQQEKYRQAIIASASGCLAAQSVENYLTRQKLIIR